MVLSRSETIERAKNCVENAIEMQEEVNKVQDELTDFQNDISSVSSNINKKLYAEDITVGCARSLGNISDEVEECSTKMLDYLKGIAKDCNEYIGKIEKEYNDDLEKRKNEAKEKNDIKITEEKLELERVNLNSNGSFSLVSLEELQRIEAERARINKKNNSNKDTSSGDNADKKTTSSYTTSSDSSTSLNENNSFGQSYSQEFIDSYKVQVDYILNYNVSTGIDSKTLNNWDNFILDFIKINNLEEDVQTIELNNGLVKCFLKNGKEYDFPNIHTYDELVETIKKII